MSKPRIRVYLTTCQATIIKELVDLERSCDPFDGRFLSRRLRRELRVISETIDAGLAGRPLREVLKQMF